MTTYYTSDSHFFHENILRYMDRPFKNVEEHDEALIKNWNEVVKNPNDVVYHLGDVGFGNKQRIKNYLHRLNGVIHLVKGNHDKKLMRGGMLDRFASVNDYLEIKVVDEEMDMIQTLVLFHYPIESWNKKHFGSWHLYAHCHGRLDNTNFKTRLDVGVDLHEYRPISYQEVKTIITRKSLGLEKGNF